MSTQEEPAWVPEPLSPQTFADRLRLLRLADGDQSVQAMAKKCGIPTPNWRKWEHGVMPYNLASVAEKIHDATGVDWQWLVRGIPSAGAVGGPPLGGGATKRP